jgi:hypothetical protein
VAAAVNVSPDLRQRTRDRRTLAIGAEQKIPRSG